MIGIKGLYKVAFRMMLTLLLLGLLTLVFNINPAKASGTIYIRVDGSIDPPTAPIQSDGNLYTFTANISDQITVEKSNIVIDGNAYTLQRSGAYYDSKGIDLTGRSHVKIENMRITGFYYGIWLSSSSNISVSGNHLENNGHGVYERFSDHNSIIGNNITTSGDFNYAVFVSYSKYGSVSGNNITVGDGHGVFLDEHSEDNSINGNNINASNGYGVYLYLHSDHNCVSGNNIASSWYGVCLYECSYNIIHHNNFIENTIQAYPISPIAYVWDDGYPSGGNYWSDYAGVDLHSGPDQDQPGSDGIGDTPYVIDSNNRDNYPLMTPYPSIHAIAIETMTASMTVVGQGFKVYLDVSIANFGHFSEFLNITTYANTTIIGIAEVTLTGGNSTIITFTWNTSGFAMGNYTISAYVAPISGETDTSDNLITDGTVTVTIPGDIDGDFDVDITDVVKITSIYGSRKGSPEFNPNSDIDGDGAITILDVVICTGHYGETWP